MIKIQDKDMRSQKAYGHYYFGDTYPVTVKHISGDSEAQHPHDLTNSPHVHDFSELVIICGGHGIHTIDGVDYPVSAGDVFLLQGFVEHHFKERHKLEFYNVMFDPSRLELPENELRRIPGYQVVFLLEPNYRKRHNFKSRLHLDRTVLAQTEKMAEAMLAEAENKAPGWAPALLGQLLNLIVFLARQYSETGKTTQGKALLRIAEIISRLENAPTKNWNLDKLAAAARMSKNNFLLVFKDATGQSPIDYLLSLRLQRAAELLRTTNMRICEIAFECGFNDSNYFSRQFRRRFDTTPMQYRRTK
jgi:AraC-like DNA-binding protein/mannose-6-phosphate isomerase-like protein (cupin superfamily)